MLRFLQQFVVGITGLDGTMVRPRWQPEPPNIPTAGTAWAAIGVTSRPSDTYPYTREVLDDDGGYTELQRHEEISLLCSFYDLGSGAEADGFASLLRDGLAIDQNREPLFLAGMGLISAGEPTAVPVLLKSRWLYRVDLGVGIRRIIVRRYPVRTILSEVGTLETGEGVTESINVNP